LHLDAGELAFFSSSTRCKTMVSRICKTIGKVTFYSSEHASRIHSYNTLFSASAALRES